MQPNKPLPHFVLLLLLTIGVTFTLPNPSQAASSASSDQDIATATIAPPGNAEPDSTPAVTVSVGPAENYTFPAQFMLDQMIFQLETVHFDFDSYALTDEARGILGRKLLWIDALKPDLQIVVVGHCDERGPATYNKRLGALRASAVKRFMVSRGLAEERIRIVSAGEEQPMVTGEGEAVYAVNRRAEIVVQ